MEGAPDAVAILGNDICEYPGAANAVRSHADGWTLTLADYRNRYALHQSDTARQAAHAACPWFLIWDDHEVHNDYAGLTPGYAAPPAPDFGARRAAAAKPATNTSNRGSACLADSRSSNASHG